MTQRIKAPDRDYEVGLVERMEGARFVLASALGIAKPKKGERIEDLASADAAALDAQGFADAARGVRASRDAYIDAVNRAWLYAENLGITNKLARAWSRKNAKNVGHIEFVEIDAEATAQMREALVQLRAPLRETLLTAVSTYLFRRLDEWMEQTMSPVTLPREEARRRTNRYSKPLD